MLKIFHSLTMINIQQQIDGQLSIPHAQLSVYFIPVKPSSLAFPKSLSARALFFK